MFIDIHYIQTVIIGSPISREMYTFMKLSMSKLFSIPRVPLLLGLVVRQLRQCGQGREARTQHFPHLASTPGQAGQSSQYGSCNLTGG